MPLSAVSTAPSQRIRFTVPFIVILSLTVISLFTTIQFVLPAVPQDVSFTAILNDEQVCSELFSSTYFTSAGTVPSVIEKFKSLLCKLAAGKVTSLEYVLLLLSVTLKVLAPESSVGVIKYPLNFATPDFPPVPAVSGVYTAFAYIPLTPSRVKSAVVLSVIFSSYIAPEKL